MEEGLSQVEARVMEFAGAIDMVLRHFFVNKKINNDLEVCERVCERNLVKLRIYSHATLSAIRRNLYAKEAIIDRYRKRKSD